MKKDLEIHGQYSCPMLKVECEKCGHPSYPNREGEPLHDCVAVLKTQVAQLQADNDSLVRKMCDL